jgi:hypothetical protein
MKNFPKLTIKEIVICALLFIPLMGLHLVFTPWLFASKPIEALEYHELKNEPAPDWANSFAINHGSAIYYKDKPSEFHPIKKNTILGVAIFLWISLLILIYRAHKREKMTPNQSLQSDARKSPRAAELKR